MKLEDCKPGARVRYFPVIGEPEFFTGTVREEPWQIGHGAWITHLKDLNRPERPRVHGALVADLELVERAPEAKSDG